MPSAHIGSADGIPPAYRQFPEFALAWTRAPFHTGKKQKKNCCNSLFIRYNARMAVTRRQKEVLDFLESFVARNGYSPSFEEIARGMGLQTHAKPPNHITNLEKKGLLDRVH